MSAKSAKAPAKTKSVPLKGTPGSVLWLMGHELRVYWRRGKMNPKSGLILAGLLLAFWGGISFLLFMRVGPAIPPPPFDNGAAAGFALAGVSMVIAFIASVIVSSSILAAVEAIYTRNDLDLLLSSPLSPWRILIVRSSAIAVGALPLYAGLLGPPLLWLAIFSSPLWLSAIIFLVTLSFAATGIALLIVAGLFRLIGPKSTRVLAQVLSAVAGAAVFLAFQYFNIAGRGSDRMTPEQAAELIGQLNIDPHAWWLFPARAMTGDLPATILWILAAAIIFPLGVFIFSRSFVTDAAAAAAMGRKKKVADVRVAAVRSGVMRSVVRKEIRLLFRDPVLLSQIGLQLVYFLPLAFPLLNPQSRLLTEAAFAPALTLLSSALSGSLIWITVSAEDAPDLISSAPVLGRHVDRAKLIAAVAPVLTLMLLPVIALIIRNPYVGVWAGAGVTAASTSSALIGLWQRKPGNRREFIRRRSGGSVLTMLGQSFVAIGLSATVGLGAYGLPWLALIPAIIAFSILGVLHRPTPPAIAAV
jgi:ABC-2 type transport system permease protein